MSEGNERLNLDELFLPVDRELRRLPRLLIAALRLVWRAARREFCLSAALQLVAGVSIACEILVARELLSRVVSIGEGTDFGDVVPWLSALAALSAMIGFANLARVEQQRLLSELVARYATTQVLEVSSAVELLAFDSPSFHNRLQRARINAATRPAQMSDGVVGTLSALLTIGGIAGALLFLEPLFLFILMVAYVPLWLATRRASRIIYAFTVKQTERDRRRDYLSFVLTRKEEAAEVRAYGLAEVFWRRYEELYAERIAELSDVVRRRMRFGFAGGLVTAILTAACMAILVWFVSIGRLGVAGAGAAAAAIALLGQRLQVLAGSTGALYESSLFIEDFTSFIDAMPALPRVETAGETVDPFRTLTVEDVTFTYPSLDRCVLDGVSLEIHQGEVVALVGENGSGKTTLAKLIAGLYSPTTGVIRWDGVDIAAHGHRVRQSVGVIFQDFVKYLLSARENVATGRYENADDDGAIFEAAQRASVHELILRLDKGYDTQLGTQFYGGSDLSVGQWQRVALARAFFRDAPFLILDEPSAALDPRSEAELFDNIRRLYSGRTVLLISHRFASVRGADRIYVLRHGRIVESGSHDELMAAKGLYAELFTLQAAAYVDPISFE